MLELHSVIPLNHEVVNTMVPISQMRKVGLSNLPGITLCTPARAAVTKCHSLGGLNNRSSGDQKSKVKVPAGLISGEASLPGLLSLPLIRTPVVLDSGPTLMTAVNLNNLFKVLVFK